MENAICVIMLTLNEEYHIGDAIDNVKDIASEIFVLDSLSSDKTVDIALSKGIQVIQRPFTNFGDQWNFALENLPIKSNWTLKLDPDERLTSELKEQILGAINLVNSADGYEFPRRLWFMGKPLNVTSNVLRLWKSGKCKFSDVLVNEHPLIDGEVDYLSGIMEHYDSRDLHHWYEKQNLYSSMEAIAKYRKSKLAAEPRLFGTSLERRIFFKKIFNKIPFRFNLLFLYNYIIKGAWKSGKNGYIWSHLRSEIMRSRELKYLEMLNTSREQFIPKKSKGSYHDAVLNSDLQKMVFKE